MNQLPAFNGFYQSDSLPLSAQECVNWYPVIPEAPSLSDRALYGCPGLDQVATAGGNASRGVHTMGGTVYFVSGNTLFSMASDHSLTALGYIEGSNRVSMANNGTQLCILNPGGAGYIYDGTLQQISDSDFSANGNPQMVVFVDGYFVFTTDEKKIIVSSLNDGLSYNALDFGSAESNPDGVVSLIVFNNQLFVGGDETFEEFSNIGGADFPFQRTGLFLDRGVMAPHSVINAPQTFMWIGGGDAEGPSVWMLNGATPQRASTEAVDAILARLSLQEIQGVYAFAYAQLGHFFVGFGLPDTTLVYDLTTQLWHERKSLISLDNGDTSTEGWRANGLVGAYGNIYAIDAKDGRIGRVDIDVYSEYGEEIRRCASTQPFINNMRPFSVPALELVFESGVGNSDAVDPVISLEISRDGGKTWSDPRERKMGKVGEYNKRAIWRRNGRTKRFDTYRFCMSDPVKPAVLGLYGEFR